MIKSFKHSGLERFYLTGSKAGIQPAHAVKLERILFQLNASVEIENMDIPGWKLHPLKGTMSDLWSVKVNGNWRVTFRFNYRDAEVVDYQDYH
jgi:proteic killer suppression protein